MKSRRFALNYTKLLQKYMERETERIHNIRRETVNEAGEIFTVWRFGEIFQGNKDY